MAQMSLIDRVDSLRAKHAALDVELTAESQRPWPRTDEIARLKRAKLHIKDEIARLDESAVTH